MSAARAGSSLYGKLTRRLLSNELRTVKTELERAKEHVQQYQAIAETQGDSLREVNATYEEYKASMEAATAEKDVRSLLSLFGKSSGRRLTQCLSQSELQSLRERFHEVTGHLATANNQNSELHRQIEMERVAFEKERKTFEDGIADLRSADQSAREAQLAAQDDMRRQAQLAKDAHDKYERELVAHAEDVKRLSEVKTELEQVRSTVREHQAATETAQANLRASEESWNRQKEVLQHELADVRKRCVPVPAERPTKMRADVVICRSEELKEHNNTLAQHLENATAQAAQLQLRHAATGEGEGESSADAETVEAIAASRSSSDEQLREVIRYLRREKDIIDLQLEFSKQEASRLRQQLDFTSRSLEEARQSLQEVRAADVCPMELPLTAPSLAGAPASRRRLGQLDSPRRSPRIDPHRQTPARKQPNVARRERGECPQARQPRRPIAPGPGRDPASPRAASGTPGRARIQGAPDQAARTGQRALEDAQPDHSRQIRAHRPGGAASTQGRGREDAGIARCR